jgi:hypothetical protein
MSRKRGTSSRITLPQIERLFSMIYITVDGKNRIIDRKQETGSRTILPRSDGLFADGNSVYLEIRGTSSCIILPQSEG